MKHLLCDDNKLHKTNTKRAVYTFLTVDALSNHTTKLRDQNHTSVKTKL